MLLFVDIVEKHLWTI